MTQTGSDTALLANTHVGRDGKRRYDSQSKLRLIEACLQPGVSVAGLVVNANQLRRWIKLHQQRSGAPVTADIVDDATTPVVPSAFVTVHQAGRGERVERTRISTPASEPAGTNPALRSRLTVEMPNGVTVAPQAGCFVGRGRNLSRTQSSMVISRISSITLNPAGTVRPINGFVG